MRGSDNTLTLALNGHGIYTAQLRHVQIADQLPKADLVRMVVAAYEGTAWANGNTPEAKRHETRTYWNRMPKAVLVVIACDTHSSHFQMEYEALAASLNLDQAS